MVASSKPDNVVFPNDSEASTRVPSVLEPSWNESTEPKNPEPSLPDGRLNAAELGGERSREETYPTNTRLFIIVVAVVLSIFLMSLDMVCILCTSFDNFLIAES